MPPKKPNPPSLLDTLRLPPHSLEAEQGVLGCIINDPQDTLMAARSKLRTESFYDIRSQAIWDAVLALNDAMVPVDLLTLSNHLKKSNLLEAVGGLAYLSELQGATPSAANFPYYQDIVLEKQVLRGLVKSASKTLDLVYTSEKDAKALVSEHLGEVESLVKADTSKIKTAKAAMGRVIDRLQLAHSGTGPKAIKTGIPLFDHKAGGLWPGDMVVVAARPSVGKTALMMQIAEAAALGGDYVGIFENEMTAEALLERIAGGRAQVNTRHVEHWRPDDFKRFTVAAAAVAKLNLLVDDTPGVSVEQIRSVTRAWVKQFNMKLICVDYVQLLTTDKPSDIREQEVAHISKTLKRIALENQITVLALAQLNRESEKKGAGPPKMSQMRESGALEQDADVAALLFRADADEEAGMEARYSGEPFRVILDVQKNRFGGVFRVPLTFLPKSQRMEEVSRVDS